MSRWILGILVGAVSLAVVAGCGGGDDDTTTVLTKAEFTKQANSICADTAKQWKAAIADYGKEVQAASDGNEAATRAAERKFANQMIDESLVPSLKEQLKQMEDLGVPAADDPKVSEMLKSLSAGVTDLEKQGVQGLVEGQNLVNFQEQAKAYGLECSFSG